MYTYISRDLRVAPYGPVLPCERRVYIYIYTHTYIYTDIYIYRHIYISLSLSLYI